MRFKIKSLKSSNLPGSDNITRNINFKHQLFVNPFIYLIDRIFGDGTVPSQFKK